MDRPYTPCFSPELPYCEPSTSRIPTSPHQEPIVDNSSSDESKDGVKFHEKETVFQNEPWINTGTQAIKVYRPTYEEMADFEAYIRKIEMDGAHKASGVCKVIPPQRWLDENRPKMLYEKVRKIRLKRALKVNILKVAGAGKVYRQENNDIDFTDEAFTVEDFAESANKSMKIPENRDIKLKEIEFWETLDDKKEYGLYGADVEDTLFSDEIADWNINKIDRLLSEFTKDIEIAGVTSPYLYFGAPDTTFSWHVEDVDLYSINYHHFGEPKFWYAIPSGESSRFERLCYQLYREELGGICKTFIRHKICIINPQVLKDHNIPYGCIPQYPGEFIITFPRGYHMGFNLGFNCNEAINFATERWFPYGLTAKMCDCNPNVAVRLQIDSFYSAYMRSHKKPFGYKSPLESMATAGNNNSFFNDVENRYKYLEKLESVDMFRRKFDEEVRFNERNGMIYPYCAVCQYFTPPNKAIAKQIPATSLDLCTRLVQRKFYGDEHKIVQDALRQCSICKLKVHIRCSSNGGTENFWLCDPCRIYTDIRNRKADPNRAYVCCEWCFTRGGALVQLLLFDEGTVIGATQHEKRFVHIVCAAANRFAWLARTSSDAIMACAYISPREHPTGREFKLLSEKILTPTRYANHNEYVNHSPFYFHGNAAENHCALCKEALTDGIVVKCNVCAMENCNESVRKMNVKPVGSDKQTLDGTASPQDEAISGLNNNVPVFHPTCAKLCDFQLILRDFPDVLVAICPRHNSENTDRSSLSCLRDGQVVYDKQEDGNFIKMEVVFKAPRENLLVKNLKNEEKRISVNDVQQCQCSEQACEGIHKLWNMLKIPKSPTSEETEWVYLVRKLHPFTYTCTTNGKTIENIERETLYTTAEMGALQRQEAGEVDDIPTDSDDSDAGMHSESSDGEFEEEPKKKRPKTQRSQKKTNLGNSTGNYCASGKINYCVSQDSTPYNSAVKNNYNFALKRSNYNSGLKVSNFNDKIESMPKLKPMAPAIAADIQKKLDDLLKIVKERHIPQERIWDYISKNPGLLGKMARMFDERRETSINETPPKIDEHPVEKKKRGRPRKQPAEESVKETRKINVEQILQTYQSFQIEIEPIQPALVQRMLHPLRKALYNSSKRRRGGNGSSGLQHKPIQGEVPTVEAVFIRRAGTAPLATAAEEGLRGRAGVEVCGGPHRRPGRRGEAVVFRRQLSNLERRECQRPPDFYTRYLRLQLFQQLFCNCRPLQRHLFWVIRSV
ncbi:unnamed protein product [Bursaphelenchus xylophilus]|uniref:(pine wood nematode) hypothetical protein n=1 Tax=Bursaphelenchus xylophilus TaxID=6326 RepID=A0A1I7RVX9_BURXY|nr:unnamed protein product [Bursaphelenchus xylophilus]CAG9094855.1 unnamed protein product [Bursaphelenchus xylophilus]